MRRAAGPLAAAAAGADKPGTGCKAPLSRSRPSTRVLPVVHTHPILQAYVVFETREQAEGACSKDKVRFPGAVLCPLACCPRRACQPHPRALKRTHPVLPTPGSAGHFWTQVWRALCACQHTGRRHPGRPAQPGGRAKGKRGPLPRLIQAVDGQGHACSALLLSPTPSTAAGSSKVTCAATAGQQACMPAATAADLLPRAFPGAILQASKPRRPHQKMESVIKVGAALGGRGLLRRAVWSSWRNPEALNVV